MSELPAGEERCGRTYQLGAPSQDGGELVLLVRESVDALQDLVGVGHRHATVVLAANGVVEDALRGVGQYTK